MKISLKLMIAPFVLVTACADNPGPPIDSRLVSVDWLNSRIGEEGLIVVDARPTNEYLEGHIPTAVSASFTEAESTSNGVYVSYGGGLDLWVDVDNPVPFQDGSAAEVESAVRSLGIDNESTVVLVDAGAHFHATRAFFTLDYFGLKDVAVLDGGMFKWEDEGFELSTDIPEVDAGNFDATVRDESLKVTTDEVLAAITDPDVQLVHSLPPAWHYGGSLPYSRYGHIPSTTMIPLGYLFNADHTWKSRETLRTLFESQEVDLDKQVVTYCGGNPLSACSYFTAKYVMGLKDVRNYHGSTIAWLEDARNLPFDTYQHPNMLRDTNWIQWFAGDRMQRLLLDPPAIVVDVRDAPDYEAEHIPWSVNLPMGSVDSPEIDRAEWADRLGAIGVGGAIEAVLCDEALTPEVAAAFFVLDYLGHTEVSVCVDGLAGWRDAGYPLTDEPTLVAEPERRLDVAVHPKEFDAGGYLARRLTRGFDGGASPPSTRKYVVASEEVPEIGADFVHVPFSAHFDEDGQLRSAYELWSLYEDAGINLFSDVAVWAPNWREAAVGYFVLRLLGLKGVSVVLAP